MPFSRSLFFLLFIGLSVYALSCAAEAEAHEDPVAKQAGLNPNGDSELAMLMRAMFEDAEQMKAAIARGEKPVPAFDHARLLTAHATEPEKAASAEYQVWAQSYLQTLQALQNGDLAMAPDLFDNMVGTCMGCHTELCPGPKVRIQKLY
jgi:hypothetical protein